MNPRRTILVRRLLCVCLALGFSTTAQAQSFSTAQRIGGIGDDAGTAIAADAAGNTYVTGWFSDSVAFSPTESRLSANGDMFVAKYDAAGNLVWVQQAIASEGSVGQGIAVDGAQNVYVTGGFYGASAIFPRLPRAYTTGDPEQTFQTFDSGFVAKYDSGGNLQWVRAHTGVAFGFAVAVNSAGSAVYVTGTFSSTADFGPGWTLTPNGLVDIFVVQYDGANGQIAWARAFGGAGNDQGRGITVDGSGNPYVTGYFNGTVAFDTTTLTSSTSSTAFLVKLDAGSGVAFWAKSGSPFDVGTGIAVDGFGNVYVSGVSAVAKFDSNPGNPNPLWYAPAIGLSSEAIAIDSAGNTYLTVTISGTVNFFPPTSIWPPACLSLLCLTGTATTAGNTIAHYVAKYDRLGRLAYFHQIDSTASSTYGDGGIGLGAGNVYITGDFAGTVLIPPTATLVSAGGFDIFRAKYNAGASGATHFVFSGIPASVTAGSSFAFTVTALDVSNNVVPGYTGTVQFTSNDTHKTLPSDSTLTNGTGQFSATLNTAGTSLTITAADANIPSIAGTSSPIIVNPAPATQFGFSSLPPSVSAGTQINNVTVTALDAFGNVATGYAGVIVLGGTDIRMSVGCVTPLVNGTQTYCVTLRSAGPQRLQASNSPFSASITSDSAPINVAPGLATQFVLFAPSSVTGGSPFNVDVAARDPFGNNDPTYAGTVHFTSSDPDPILPLDSTLTNGLRRFSAVLNTAGTRTINVTDNVLRPGSASIVVNGSAAKTATGVNVSVQPVDPVTGAPQPTTVTFSNVTTAGGTTAAAVQLPPPANFSLNQSQLYDIATTAQYTGRLTVCFTGSFTSADVIWHYEAGGWVQLLPSTFSPPSGPPYTQICAQTNSLSPFGVFRPVLPDHISVSPASGVITAGGSQAYAAQAFDAFNNSMGDVTTGTVFGISPDGSCTSATCTATTTGPHTVTGTYGALTATATLSVIGVSSTFLFQGFFAPVDMSTSTTLVWNTVKAGRAVPVKWLLASNGTPVSDPASLVGLSSYPIACSSGSGSVDDAIDQSATGNSGLQYNGSGNWQFNWQTLAAYTNSCRAVVVKFSDGTTSAAANFKFK